MFYHYKHKIYDKNLSVRIIPSKVQYDALLLNNDVPNELLVYGFIRWCSTLDEFEMVTFPYLDIVELIVLWYNEQIVYLKRKYSDMHWKISLDDIQ